MEMHRRRDGDIGNGNLVTCQPLRLSQLGVQDPGELVPRRRLGIDDGLIRFGFEQWFDDELDKIDVAALEPHGGLPQQPAIDGGAVLQVSRVGRRVTAVGVIGGILQNRVRFGDDAVSVDGGRDGGVGVDLEIRLTLVLTGEVVDVVEVVLGVEEVEAGQHLAAVDGAGIEIDFQHG